MTQRVSEGAQWLLAEFRRARQRRALLPRWARPVVTPRDPGVTEDEAYAIKYLYPEYTQKYIADAYEVSHPIRPT